MQLIWILVREFSNVNQSCWIYLYELPSAEYCNARFDDFVLTNRVHQNEFQKIRQQNSRLKCTQRYTNYCAVKSVLLYSILQVPTANATPFFIGVCTTIHHTAIITFNSPCEQKKTFNWEKNSVFVRFSSKFDVIARTIDDPENELRV